jgi:N-acetylneuraminic acid mutarotase
LCAKFFSTVLFFGALIASPSLMARNCPATPNLPTGRWGSAATIGKDNKIYVMGGWANGTTPNPTNANEAYNIATESWEQLAPIPVGVQGASAATGPDGTIYLFGGFDSAKVFAYDPATDTWSTRQDLPRTKAYTATLTASDGTIFVTGGYENPIGHADYIASTFSYDPATDTWTQLADMLSGRENGAITEGPDGSIYMVGGICNNFCGEVERYDRALNVWQALPTMIANRFGLGAFTGPNGALYAIGGHGSEPGNNTDSSMTSEMLLPDANSWQYWQANPKSLSSFSYAQDSRGFAYMFGGLAGEDYASNELNIFDTFEGQWCGASRAPQSHRIPLLKD